MLVQNFFTYHVNTTGKQNTSVGGACRWGFQSFFLEVDERYISSVGQIGPMKDNLSFVGWSKG
jgi:hypothetical protein